MARNPGLSRRGDGLSVLFRPSCVAVLGVSASEANPATRTLRALARSSGAPEIYPVNPKYSELFELRCYASVSVLPQVPDLVVVALRAAAVCDAVTEAADAGARAFVVLSSGFAEVSEQGEAEEDRLADLARARGLVILGPNSLGYINIIDGVYASFSSVVEGPRDLRPGRVALVTQSGAIGAFVYAMAESRGFGFSHIVSTGNEAVLEAADVAGHLLASPDVEGVAFYLEGIRDGSRFRAVCEAAGRAGKKVVVLRAGDSEQGRAAAKSHTGAMAGLARVSDSVLSDLGVIRVLTPEDLLAACRLVESRRLPPGRRAGVISVSGGLGVLAADAAARWDVPLPLLVDETRQELSDLLPPWAAVGNPTDVTATVLLDEADTLARSIVAMSRDPRLDVLVLLMGAGAMGADGVARQFIRSIGESKKPCLLVWLGIPPSAGQLLSDAGIPYFESVEECIRTLSSVSSGAWSSTAPDAVFDRDAVTRSQRLAAERILSEAGPGVIDEVRSKEFLEAAGLTCLPRRCLVPRDSPRGQLERVFGQFRGPVAVKVVARGVTHKNAIGGVVTGASTPESFLSAVQQVLDAADRAVGPDSVLGLLVEAMAQPGAEVLAGFLFDDAFGYQMVVGAGGIYTELIDDVVIMPAPVSREHARLRLRDSTVERMLIGHGSRESPEYDVPSLCALVSRLSSMAASLPGGAVRELDINPVIVHRDGSGATAVDCVISR